MDLKKYPVEVSDNYRTYLFFSEGRQGKIKKRVIYTQIEGSLYNLGFGDWNDEFQKLDDLSRTNNGDRNKVLATVAYTILDFTKEYPNALIYIEGSTAGRTRLYQMGIANNLLEVTEFFMVKGLLDKHWELFQHGRNYNAFLVIRK